MFKVTGVSRVQGDRRRWCGAPSMFKVMGGGERASHVQGDSERGWEASAMFKVIGGAPAMSKVI